MTTYDAKDCTVMVNGVYITGLGEDMITGEKDEDNFETTVGAQGDVCISTKNDPLGTTFLFSLSSCCIFTVSVQATSPQKNFLLGLAKVKEPFPIWIINKTLGERIGGSLALLKKSPEASRGATVEDMEFEFGVFDYVFEGTD